MATILIAEDDATIRRVCAMWLERAGHRVVEAGNGQEAMELLQVREVDLLISDVHMPILDGIDLVAWWRVEKEASQPVIMISASCNREDVAGRMRDLDVLFVPKPFSPQKLTETVDGLLLGKSVPPEGKHAE